MNFEKYSSKCPDFNLLSTTMFDSVPQPKLNTQFANFSLHFNRHCLQFILNRSKIHFLYLQSAFLLVLTIQQVVRDLSLRVTVFVKREHNVKLIWRRARRALFSKWFILDTKLFRFVLYSKYKNVLKIVWNLSAHG